MTPGLTAARWWHSTSCRHSSAFAFDTCSLDGSKAVLSDARADYGKMVALNIPPALIVSNGGAPAGLDCILQLGQF